MLCYLGLELIINNREKTENLINYGLLFCGTGIAIHLAGGNLL
jgi:hypothetical protein